MSLEEAMSRIFGSETSEVAALRKQLEDSGFLEYFKLSLSQIGGYGGSMSGEYGLMLYMAVRLLPPEVAVETG